MTRYLALPKNDHALAQLSLSSVTMRGEDREDQIRRVVDMRRAHGAPHIDIREGGRGRMVAAHAQSHSAKILGSLNYGTRITGMVVFELDNEQSLDALRLELPEYDLIEDLPLSLIPPVGSDVSLNPQNSLDTWHLDAVQVNAARTAGYSGRGNGVGVAILDTGVEDVKEIEGRVKWAYALDKKTDNVKKIKKTRDTCGHGTHVAGLVAGTNVGVAPEAALMNFIMIPGGQGNFSDFIFAMEFAAQRPEISIINISGGIRGYNDSMRSAVDLIRRVGVLPVIAIGNEGPDATCSPGNYTEVLSVGASTQGGKVADFSGGGTIVVSHTQSYTGPDLEKNGNTTFDMIPHFQSYTVPDLVAPGKDVTSCVMGGAYEAWSGTSMATPLVSGVAALIVERSPSIDLASLIAEITAAAALSPLSGEPVTRQGSGLLQFPRHIWSASSP